MARNFMELLRPRWAKGNFVCIGLDSELAKLPQHLHSFYKHNVLGLVAQFNMDIIEATAEFACAYKPNVAFYEALGKDGMEALRLTIQAVHTVNPEIPVILD